MLLVANKGRFNKGFVLLYAILLTGLVTTVGVVLMNILTKQIVFSSIGQGSESAYYYTANSGRECANYFAKRGKFFSCSFGPMSPTGEYTASCSPEAGTVLMRCFKSGASVLSLNSSPPTVADGVYTYDFNHVDVESGGSVNIVVSVNPSCLDKKFSYPQQLSCANANDSVYKRYGLVIESSGYSLPSSQINNPRRIKRTAIMVRY